MSRTKIGPASLLVAVMLTTDGLRWRSFFPRCTDRACAHGVSGLDSAVVTDVRT